MEIDKLKNIIENFEHKSNKDLLTVKEELEMEYEKTKKLIIDLTYHMESIENMYQIINKELVKRNVT